MNNFGGKLPKNVNVHHVLAADWMNHPYICTNTVASLLHIKPQTIRKWACYEQGPLKIRPLKVAGKLLWETKAVIKLLNIQ